MSCPLVFSLRERIADRGGQVLIWHGEALTSGSDDVDDDERLDHPADRSLGRPKWRKAELFQIYVSCIG